MDNRPIGVFDSGVGGLTGLKALREMLPEENYIFFSDAGRCPYGPRPKEELRRIALQDMDFLASLGVKAILSACGTISSTAHAELDGYPIPAFGVLKPALEAMTAIGGDGPLAILATEASIRSGRFTDALRELCPGREVIGVPCPRFVSLVQEEARTDPEDPILQAAVAEALAALRERRPAAALLGCTHFGFIAEAIGRFLGEDVRLISASECGARALRDNLIKNGRLGEGGSCRFYTSGDAAAFNEFAGRYLETGPIRAAEVPVMEVEKSL